MNTCNAIIEDKRKKDKTTGTWSGYIYVCRLQRNHKGVHIGRAEELGKPVPNISKIIKEK